MVIAAAWRSLARSLPDLSEPVAMTFCDSPPPGVERVKEAAPAGCSYWKLAADGQAFYTTADDHLNCPIGAYTHGAATTPDVQTQLGGMLDHMVGIKYLKASEIPSIPHRTQPLRYVAYAPLSQAQETPDVVLLRGDAKQIMLVAEAAQACGAMAPGLAMGRPACAVIAATIERGQVNTSFGCIGNRVYTDLPDDEFYVGVPGPLLGEMTAALTDIVMANAELEQFHRGRVVH